MNIVTHRLKAKGIGKFILILHCSFLLYWFCVVIHSCRAQDELNTIQDCASSCGDIHNIGYPFRLNTDPEHCGDMNHELACKDDAVTLYLPVIWGVVVGYRVQAINYNNFTIRLADPNVHMDNCTLSVTISLRYYDFLSSADYMQRSASSDFTQDLYRSLILISCAYPATGSLDEYNSPCNKLDSSSSSHMKRYWYVKVGDMKSSDLANWCRIEAITMTSLLPEGARNISYIDVINSFAFGFELAWEPDCCASEGSRKYNCSGFLQYCQIDKQDLNNHLFWPGKSKTSKLIQDEMVSDRSLEASNNCLAVVPWVAVQPPTCCPTYPQQPTGSVEAMEAEEVQAEMMDIEDFSGSSNGNRVFDVRGVLQEWQQHQQHCIAPQHFQSNSSPVPW